MELRDFAEQVLFATSLDEKISGPETVTDDQPGSPIVTPTVPGRPADLRFKSMDSTPAVFSGRRWLHQEHQRGACLHFFANHELLATELMALVLLRFPDAPPAFRRGVFQTLRDEQAHTRLYLTRMRHSGIAFGELPVSGYFWRAISTMESPMDYVAGLSLTFEQANLDFCRHFAREFKDVGDIATAQLLERIYRDEIAHVAYGLKWFRRWKQPESSDWDAFCRQLRFPLSPQRAKGFGWNVEARRAAGFDATFIAALRVFSQSKGRTPGVFVFNPFTEGYLAHGKSFTPVKHQLQLACDLENLPQFLSRQDDIVLLGKRPSVGFLSTLKDAGFALPEFVEFPGRTIPPDAGLCRRKLARLRPWAWGPDSMELFRPLFANVTGEYRPPEQCFNEAIAELYGKAWSASFLRRFLPRWSHLPWLCTDLEIGVTVTTLDEALGAIQSIRGRGHHRVVAKECFGLAGHNAIRLWEPTLLDAHRRWLQTAVRDQEKVVIEPWLERELDFSIQLEMQPDGLKLVGFSGLIIDSRGQFQGNWAEPNHRSSAPRRVSNLLGLQRDATRQLHRLFVDLFQVLETDLNLVGYRGPIGIDAFIYRVPDGSVRLKPIVEINPRYTMGRLTLELMRQACPGSYGLFHLVGRAPQCLDPKRAPGVGDFPACARNLLERFPLRLEGAPVPRICGGVVCLNDPLEAKVCLAVFQVARTLAELGLGQ